MRAQTVTHVEYEIFQYILDEIDVELLKEQMCPSGDLTAESRWEKGLKNTAKLIGNLCERRLHKLPKNHLDYKEK